jgi:transposase
MSLTLLGFPLAEKWDWFSPRGRITDLEGKMGAAVGITRLQHGASELRGLAVKCSDTTVARRLLGIAMVLEGVSRPDAARQTGMDRQTLRDWVHRYNEEGVTGLSSRKAPGAVGKLSTEQMAQLRDLVLAGPNREVHQVVRFRCVDLCAEVEKRFSVVVSERTMGKWLHKLGLTRVQPRPYHPKKDEAAQDAFKKTLKAA